MECIHYKGRMKRGTAAFSLDRNGYHFSGTLFQRGYAHNAENRFLKRGKST